MRIATGLERPGIRSSCRQEVCYDRADRREELRKSLKFPYKGRGGRGRCAIGSGSRVRQPSDENEGLRVLWFPTESGVWRVPVTFLDKGHLEEE